ncbi:LexA family transcriptional regulator [Acetobacter persici]|uniref:HTH cro/C1-type domain-containing protein n=1 Tax=Acetobacter persici TaxID=1076596 RepID=A0A6V8I8A0_9PROT|nr:LexA family transcriptional regulator [Acetobacter persici]OUI89921.1 hypothetical protein HK19_13410 [Acetobacter persici]GFE93534.1 hypothetical protein DmAi_15930 [Acetobacter persici]
MAEIFDLSENTSNRQETEFAARVREAVKSGGGYSTVLEKSGFSSNSLNRYLKGHEMKVSTAIHLAEICGVDPQWLLFGTRSDVDMHHASADGVGVAYYEEAEASAGFGRYGHDRPEPRKVFISRCFLEDLGLLPHHTIMLRVAGDSMEPTLKSGDRLILNTAPTTLLGGVTVFVVNGQLMVKRLSPTASGTVMIISDNDRYPPQEAEISRFRWGEADGNDTITVIGRVAYRLQAMS